MSRSRRRRSLYHRDLRPLLYLLLPFVVLLLVVDVAPLVLGVISSMLRLNIRTLKSWTSAPFAAGVNYHQAVSGHGGLALSGLQAMWQTVEFAVIATVIALPVGVLGALTVSQSRSRATTIVRAIYILPVAMPLFSTAFVWRMILFPSTGLLDQVRGLFGGTPSNHLLIGGHSFAVFVGVDVWFAWGFIYLFALAGLQSISHELYEAAAIDGARSWQKFRYIVAPALSRVMLVAVVLSTLNHYNNFTLPFVLFGTAPPPGVITVPLATYLAGFSLFNFGLADAVAIVGLIGIVVPILVYVWIAGGSRMREREG
jgi:multiple sugar transport system permease protein